MDFLDTATPRHPALCCPVPARPVAIRVAICQVSRDVNFDANASPAAPDPAENSHSEIDTAENSAPDVLDPAENSHSEIDTAGNPAVAVPEPAENSHSEIDTAGNSAVAVLLPTSGKSKTEGGVFKPSSAPTSSGPTGPKKETSEYSEVGVPEPAENSHSKIDTSGNPAPDVLGTIAAWRLYPHECGRQAGSGERINGGRCLPRWNCSSESCVIS